MINLRNQNACQILNNLGELLSVCKIDYFEFTNKQLRAAFSQSLVQNTVSNQKGIVSAAGGTFLTLVFLKLEF